MFVSKAGAYQKHQTRLEIGRDKHYGLLGPFVSYGRKKFENALAYFSEEKSLITSTPGPNVIKHFTAVIYECS